MNVQKLGEIIRGKRQSTPLSLKQLSAVSGVSTSHPGRIELGQRRPSPYTLLRIARPLDLDFNELLTLAGYPSLEPSMLTKRQRDRLRAELHKRVDRVIAESKRIREITNQLLGSD
jgi:transcriptional regulator with XRE-family HTH domain